MHAFWIALTLGLTLTAWRPGGRRVLPEGVTVPDAALRRVLEDSLGLSAGAPITEAALAKLTVLEAPDKGIADVTGLASATGLTRAEPGPVDTGDPWANSNAVSDLSPLSGLTALTWMHLTGNSVADVTPLSGLTGLTFLNLQVNEIAAVDFAVATLVEGSYPQGTFASSWDGTAHDGQEVARGVYVYRSLPDRTLSRTLTSSGDLHASTDSSPGGYPCLSRMGRSTNRSVWLHRRTLPIDHTPIGGGPASGHPLNGRAAPPTARTSYPQPGE